MPQAPDPATRLRVAKATLEAWSQGLLLPCTPPDVQEKVGALLGKLTEERLAKVVADPARLPLIVAELERRIDALRPALTTVKKRLTDLGYDLSDSGIRRILGRAGSAGIQRICSENLGPDRVSVLPDGTLRLVTRPSPAPPVLPTPPPPPTVPSPPAPPPVLDLPVAEANLQAVLRVLDEPLAVHLDRIANRLDSVGAVGVAISLRMGEMPRKLLDPKSSAVEPYLTAIEGNLLRGGMKPTSAGALLTDIRSVLPMSSFKAVADIARAWKALGRDTVLDRAVEARQAYIAGNEVGGRAALRAFILGILGPSAAVPLLLPPVPALPPPPAAPVVAPSVPSQAELIAIAEEVQGNTAEMERAVRLRFSGWWNASEAAGALGAWVRDLVGRPNTRFTIRWTSASPASDLSGPSILSTTHFLGDAGSMQPPGESVWRRVAIPADRLSEQARAYGGAALYTEEAFVSRNVDATGRTSPARADEVQTPEVSPKDAAVAAGRYFIESIEDGAFRARIDDEAYDAVLFTSGTGLAVATRSDGSDTVSGTFGTVLLTVTADGGYSVDSDEGEGPITGFLAELERLNLASCGSALCVSAYLSRAVADDGNATLLRIRQGLEANLLRWTADLGSAFRVTFISTGVREERGRIIVEWVQSGETQGEAHLTAGPGDEDKVRWRLQYDSITTGARAIIEGSTAFADFVTGADVALAAMERVESEGWFVQDVALPEGGGVVSGVGGLSDEAVLAIISDLRTLVRDRLVRTAYEGTLMGLPPTPRPVIPVPPLAPVEARA